MKRKVIALAAGAVALLALTGCEDRSGDLDDAAKAQEACQEIGGEFEMHGNLNGAGWYDPYSWDCHIGDDR